MKQQLIDALQNHGYSVVSADAPMILHDGKTILMQSRVCQIEGDALKSVLNALMTYADKNKTIYVYQVEIRSICVKTFNRNNSTCTSGETQSQVVFRGYY